MRPITTALTALTVLFATSCGDATSTSTSDAATTTTTLVASTTSTLVPAAPDVQDGIAWFVSLLNGADITADEYEQRFGDEFRAQVPFDTDFQAVLAQFRPSAPYKIVASNGSETQGDAIIEASDGTRLRVVAEVDDAGIITTLFIQPTEQPELDDPPESIAAAHELLAEMGRVRAVSAEIIDESCVPLESVASSEPAPLGSVFKLYVLAAVGEAVAAGTLSWDDEVVVRDELKSIPTGELQNRPAGDTVSVLEAAELMISISDNTATDHLIDLLGREAVEAVQAEYGHTRPEINTPFLSTRELTALKVGPASGLRDPQWIEGDETTRREILNQVADITPEDLPLAGWVAPIDPDLVEWFATMDDLCTLAARLLGLANRVPEIADILEINPGIPDAAGLWERIWFKGGSEPGLLAGWWVTEAAGRVFLTVGSGVNPAIAFDPTQAKLVLAAARDLLAPQT